MIWSIIWFLMGLWLGFGIKSKLAWYTLRLVRKYQILDQKYLNEKSKNHHLKNEINELKENLKTNHPAPSGQGKKRGGKFKRN